MENEFVVKKIDEQLFARIKGKSYKADCIIPVEDLRYLHVLHWDLKGRVQAGELICNAYIVYDLIDIFYRLYRAEYPIEKIRLVDEYDAEDELSMRDNNSSCFNFRLVSRSNQISKHGLGLAVDINPLYNPYVTMVDGRQNVEPSTAGPYLDRNGEFPCKIDEQDFCCRLFAMHGFEWGGDWVGKKDYQHFEVPDEVVGMLYADL